MALLIAGVLALYVLGGAYLYVFQRRYLYFPTEQVDHSHETMTLTVGVDSLSVITLRPGKSDAVIYFGGNAEPIPYSAADVIDVLPDQTIYLLNYRGYDQSTGYPTEQHLFDDALRLYDQVAEQHDSISVAGRSLGTGVAVYLASERTVRKLVLITPYDSIRAVAENLYPIYPVNYLLKDHFDSLSRAPDINAPVLAIVAENDAIIPRIHSMNLVEGFTGTEVELLEIPGSDHNNLSESPLYYPRIRDFLRK